MNRCTRIAHTGFLEAARVRLGGGGPKLLRGVTDFARQTARQRFYEIQIKNLLLLTLLMKKIFKIRLFSSFDGSRRNLKTTCDHSRAEAERHEKAVEAVVERMRKSPRNFSGKVFS